VACACLTCRDAIHVGIYRQLISRGLEPILSDISEVDVRSKQEVIAALSPRLVLQLEDGEEDALSILMSGVVA